MLYIKNVKLNKIIHVFDQCILQCFLTCDSSPHINTNLTLQQRNLPLFLSPNFDLRAHVESMGHGVAGCTDLRLTPRRCAGFLTKRGGRVKTWKKRWFLFDMDHRRLAYYTG